MTKRAWMVVGAALTLTACGSNAPSAEKTAALPAGEQLTVTLAETTDMKAVGAEITTRDQNTILQAYDSAASRSIKPVSGIPDSSTTTVQYVCGYGELLLR